MNMYKDWTDVEIKGLLDSEYLNGYKDGLSSATASLETIIDVYGKENKKALIERLKNKINDIKKY